MNVAIIPARGGSKRIPRKNILPFFDKPIISHSIKTAISSQLFDKVIVSTDNAEIAPLSKSYGAEIPFVRPSDLSDDHTGIHLVINHAVRWLVDNGNNIDNVCCLYATAPLIIQDDLSKSLEILEKGGWESVVAAVEFPSPIFRAFKLNENGGIKMFFPEHYSSRSQDLPEAYHDAGQFYWAKPEIWKEKPKGYDDKTSLIKIPNFRVKDLDTFDDWDSLEIIYKLLNKKN